MMTPMHRVIDMQPTNEFYSARIAIHFRSILFAEQHYLKLIEIQNDMEDSNATIIPHMRYEDGASVSSTSEISLNILNMSISLYNLKTKLDHYITRFHQLNSRFHICPLLLNRKENGLDEHNACCQILPSGIDVMVSFEEE